MRKGLHVSEKVRTFASHLRNTALEELSKLHRGVAQLVAFLVWDQAVAGSSPVTPTPKEGSIERCFLFSFT